MSNLFSFNLSFNDIIGISSPALPTPPPALPTPSPIPDPTLPPEYYIKHVELDALSVYNNKLNKHSFTGIEKMGTIFTKLDNFKKNVLDTEKFNHIINMKAKNYRTIYITSDIHADIRKLLKLLIDEGIISITPNKHTDKSSFDPYTDHIYEYPFIDNINFLKNNMLFIILGDLVDGKRDKTKVDDPRGNFELILHIFLFNMRLKARDKHSEVLFTLGNHDFVNIILNKNGDDILSTFRHSRDYFYVFNAQTITNPTIFYDVFNKFYEMSPYIMLFLQNDKNVNSEFMSPYIMSVLQNDNNVNSEFKCIHASFNHSNTEKDTDAVDKTDKLRILQDHINTNGLKKAFITAETRTLLGNTAKLTGLLWSRFYTTTTCDIIRTTTKYNTTIVVDNTTIVVGHCPTPTYTRINNLEVTQPAQPPYDGCAGLTGVDNVSARGCVVADCFENGIPKILFVDTMMSQAFYPHNTTHERSEQTCEFLLLEHDTTLIMINKGSKLIRWINKISRKPAGYDAKYLYKEDTQKPLVREPTATTRANIFDFICAQQATNIKSTEQQITTAIDEIKYKEATLQTLEQFGKKTGHWMWYILPSDLDASTANALFFHLGPNAKANKDYGSITLSIEEYLDNEILRTNYMRIIDAIFTNNRINNNLDEHKLKAIMQGYNNVDYDKLQRSLINFTPILIAKLELINKNINKLTNKTNNDNKKFTNNNTFINNIKTLHNIVNQDKQIT